MPPKPKKGKASGSQKSSAPTKKTAAQNEMHHPKAVMTAIIHQKHQLAQNGNHISERRLSYTRMTKATLSLK